MSVLPTAELDAAFRIAVSKEPAVPIEGWSAAGPTITLAGVEVGLKALSWGGDDPPSRTLVLDAVRSARQPGQSIDRSRFGQAAAYVWARRKLAQSPTFAYLSKQQGEASRARLRVGQLPEAARVLGVRPPVTAAAADAAAASLLDGSGGFVSLAKAIGWFVAQLPPEPHERTPAALVSKTHPLKSVSKSSHVSLRSSPTS